MIATGNPGLGTLSSYSPIQTDRTRYALRLGTTLCSEAFRWLESDGYVLMPAHRDVIAKLIDPGFDLSRRTYNEL